MLVYILSEMSMYCVVEISTEVSVLTLSNFLPMVQQSFALHAAYACSLVAAWLTELTS